MATTKIVPIKKNIAVVSDYIQDKNKTADGTLVTTFGCLETNVKQSFMDVINHPLSTKRSVLARHLIQSFMPNEVDADTAHQIGLELCEKHLQGKYQYVIATHVDKGHIHNHILFNNVSFIDYHCYNSNKKSYKQIRDISDELCKEYGLNVIEKQDRNKLRKNPYATESRYKNIYRDQVRKDIDHAIKKSVDIESYLDLMRENYEIKQGKYTSYRHKNNGQERFVRSRSLGYKYQDDIIPLRIDREFMHLSEIDNDLPLFPSIGKLIDIKGNKKMQTEGGLRYWALKQNNKIFGKTLVKMRAVGAESYEQLENLLAQIDEDISALSEEAEIVKTSYKDLLNQEQKLTKMHYLIQSNSTQKEPSTERQIEELKEDLLVNYGLDIATDKSLDTELKSLLSKLEKVSKDISEKNKEINKLKDFARELGELKHNYIQFKQQKDRNTHNRNRDYE